MSEAHGVEAGLDLRQLRHEMANDLAVISMGLRALSGVRDDDHQFSEVVEMMEGNVASLKERVKILLELSASLPPAE